MERIEAVERDSFADLSYRSLLNVNSEMRIRIVLASDDTITREGLRSILHRAPEIEIIGESETIVGTPKNVNVLVPDVVLIEVSVPGRAHGLRAATTIAEQTPKSRVVVLTNSSDLFYVRSMLAAGVSGYLLKNSEISQLFVALRKVRLGGRFIDPTLSNDLVWHAIDRKTKKVDADFSARESEVFSNLVRGYTNVQSAHLLKLSIKTVETYRLRICRKLHLRTRADLVEYALANRLLAEK